MKKIMPITLACLLILLFVGCSVTTSDPRFSAQPSVAEESFPPTPPPIQTPDTTPAPLDTDPPTTVPSATNPPSNDKQEALDAYKTLTASLVTEPNSQMAIDVDMTMDMDMRISGQTQTNHTNGNIKTKDMGGGKVACSMILDMGGLGVMEIVTDGDRIYAAMNGTELDLSMDDMDEQLDTTYKFPELTLDAMTDISTWQEGGNSYTKITLDGEKLTSFALDFAEQMAASMGTSVECNVGDMSVLLVTDGAGILKSMSYEAAMSLTAMGQSIEIDLSYEYSVNAIGDDVVIDFSKLG